MLAGGKLGQESRYAGRGLGVLVMSPHRVDLHRCRSWHAVVIVVSCKRELGCDATDTRLHLLIVAVDREDAPQHAAAIMPDAVSNLAKEARESSMDCLYCSLQALIWSALRKPMVAHGASEEGHEGFIRTRLHVAGSASWKFEPLRPKSVREHDPRGLVIEACGGDSAAAEATIRMGLKESLSGGWHMDLGIFSAVIKTRQRLRIG